VKIFNLTPHDINVYGKNDISEGPLWVYRASGIVARVATIELGTQRIAGSDNPPIIYEMVEYGRLNDLPSSEEGSYFIVSLVAALAVRGRRDILAPYIEVRNEQGTMIGCRYLQKVC
jgi:hypothetical protein